MYLSSHWPPYPCAIFFDPSPFRIQLSFVNPISPFILIPPWSEAHNIYSPPPAILHLSSTYLQSYDIRWGGQGKRKEAGGEERKEGVGVGRGMKQCKNMEGREKRKILRVPLREGRRETRGGKGEAYPLIFENKGDDSFGSKKPPPLYTHTNTPSGLKPAVTTLKNV